MGISEIVHGLENMCDVFYVLKNGSAHGLNHVMEYYCRDYGSGLSCGGRGSPWRTPTTTWSRTPTTTRSRIPSYPVATHYQQLPKYAIAIIISTIYTIPSLLTLSFYPYCHHYHFAVHAMVHTVVSYENNVNAVYLMDLKHASQ